MRFEPVINQMEQSIIDILSDLERAHAYRKWAISEKTGIPEDILTVLLKRLKISGKIELMIIWSDITGMPDGSGYCLKGKNN